MFLFTLATFRIFFFILDFQHFCYDMFRDLGEVFTYSFFFNSLQGLPRWLNGKKSACQCRSYRRCRFDLWVWKIHWGGNGTPLQYSCLGNPMDRGAWRATVHRVAKSQR